MSEENKVIAYKAFNKDWTCRDFQFEVGKEYTHNGNVEVCRSGFHACEYPLDIFYYYNPCTSLFAVTEVSGIISKNDEGDTKLAAQKMFIKKELSIADLCKAALDYTMSRTIDSGSQHTTGYRAASTATGDQAASTATGDQAASTATGYQAASLTTGNYSSSKIEQDESHCVAMGVGYDNKVMAPLNSAIFLVERNENLEIIHVFSSIVGQNGVLPNVWYMLKEGKLIKVEDNG